jgi:DNA primase
MSIIDEIYARLDIVAVVGRYINLTKTGRNYKGRSPFQAERTPSFFVFPDSRTFKDFASGAQGDMFGFVMRKEGWTFSEAVRELARWAGLRPNDDDDEREPA